MMPAILILPLYLIGMIIFSIGMSVCESRNIVGRIDNDTKILWLFAWPLTFPIILMMWTVDVTSRVDSKIVKLINKILDKRNK